MAGPGVKQRKRTVVIHSLFETPVPLFQHLCVDVDHIHGCLSVGVLLPCVVQYPQCNVTGTACKVDTSHWALSSWSQ